MISVAAILLLVGLISLMAITFRMMWSMLQGMPVVEATAGGAKGYLAFGAAMAVCIEMPKILGGIADVPIPDLSSGIPIAAAAGIAGVVALGASIASSAASSRGPRCTRTPGW